MIKHLLAKFGIRALKFFADTKCRPKVQPIPGSVVYCELYGAVEHSGIYIGNGEISNIVVNGLAKAKVERSDKRDFMSSSLLLKEVYVSADKHGAVGGARSFRHAQGALGEQRIYGYILKNCHSFSKECIEKENIKIKGWQFPTFSPDFCEPSIQLLKKEAKVRIGATKWLIWGGGSNTDSSKLKEPNAIESRNFFQNVPLTEDNAQLIKEELAEAQRYYKEIADENISRTVKRLLVEFINNLEEISSSFQMSQALSKSLGFSCTHRELQKIPAQDIQELTRLIDSKKVLDIITHLGRSYVSKKEKKKLSQRRKSLVHGIYKSDDLARILPNELLTFGDEELEALFYQRYLEQSLLTYELVGEEKDKHGQKGPIIVCLDTSGSMEGKPILLARALLLSISKILEKEHRELYVILFGASNELKELNVSSGDGNKGQLLSFLFQEYSGGTDFETPLKRAMEIVSQELFFNKADILMLTDGCCSIKSKVKNQISEGKEKYGFNIYTVVCDTADYNQQDGFSDKVFCL